MQLQATKYTQQKIDGYCNVNSVSKRLDWWHPTPQPFLRVVGSDATRLASDTIHLNLSNEHNNTTSASYDIIEPIKIYL